MKKHNQTKGIFYSNNLTGITNYIVLEGHNSGTTTPVIIYKNSINNNYYSVTYNPTGNTLMAITVSPTTINMTLEGSINTFTINNSGHGYKIGDYVTVLQTDTVASGGVFVVTSLNSLTGATASGVTGLALVSSGINYHFATGLTTTNSTTTGATGLTINILTINPLSGSNTSGLTVINQYSNNVTNLCAFSSLNTNIATVDANGNVYSGIITGSTSIITNHIVNQVIISALSATTTVNVNN